MTEAEINLAIAKIEYPDHKIRPWIDSANVTPVGHPRIRGIDYMEWCWIGPIIEREKIDLTAIEDGWEANGYFYVISALAKTPTKAAALCYLKMKGLSNEKMGNCREVAV